MTMSAMMPTKSAMMTMMMMVMVMVMVREKTTTSMHGRHVHHSQNGNELFNY